MSYYDKQFFKNYHVLAEKLHRLMSSNSIKLGYYLYSQFNNHHMDYFLRGVHFAQMDLKNNRLILNPGFHTKRNYGKHFVGVFGDLVTEYIIDFSFIKEESLTFGECNIPISEIINSTIERSMIHRNEDLMQLLDFIIRDQITNFGQLKVVHKPNRVEYEVNQLLVASLVLSHIPQLILLPGLQFVEDMEEAYECNSRFDKEPDEVSIFLGKIESRLTIWFASYIDEDDDFCLDEISIEELVELTIRLRLGLKSDVKLEGYRYLNENL